MALQGKKRKINFIKTSKLLHSCASSLWEYISSSNIVSLHSLLYFFNEEEKYKFHCFKLRINVFIFKSKSVSKWANREILKNLEEI